MNKKTILKLCGATGTAIGSFLAYQTAKESFDLKKNVVLALDSTTSTVTSNSDMDEISSEYTLKQAQVFFRHGARTPLGTIPNVQPVNWDAQLFLSGLPHTLYDYTVYEMGGGPCPDSPLERHYRKGTLKGGAFKGQLTNLGQDQTYLLGRRLQKQYIEQHGLITGDYHPDTIFPRSTNTQRTIDSLRCVLAGIYGVDHLKSVNEVKFFTLNMEDEFLFPNSHHCRFMKQLNHKTLTNYGNLPGVHEDRWKIEELLGIDLISEKKKINMVMLRDDMACRTSHGFPIPQKLIEFQPAIYKYALSMMVYANSGTEGDLRDTVLRLAVGRSLRNLLEKINGAIKGESSHKLILYSCHDTTLLALLVAMGIYDDRWPPFAADISVELYENKSGEHFVSINYIGENMTKKRFGSAIIPVKEFEDSLSKYITSDKGYDNLCNTTLPESLVAPGDLGLPEGSQLPDHVETPEESDEAEEEADRPTGM